MRQLQLQLDEAKKVILRFRAELDQVKVCGEIRDAVVAEHLPTETLDTEQGSNSITGEPSSPIQTIEPFY